MRHLSHYLHLFKQLNHHHLDHHSQENTIQVKEVEGDVKAEAITDGEAEVMVDGEVDLKVGTSPSNTIRRDKPIKGISTHQEK